MLLFFSCQPSPLVTLFFPVAASLHLVPPALPRWHRPYNLKIYIFLLHFVGNGKIILRLLLSNFIPTILIFLFLSLNFHSTYQII